MPKIETKDKDLKSVPKVDDISVPEDAIVSAKEPLLKPKNPANTKDKIAKDFELAIKKYCNLGTIGHVDHGKTSLTSAITIALSRFGGNVIAYGEIDNIPEEQKRGITINKRTVTYEGRTRSYIHIDTPGHRDFVRTMLAGTTQMDFAILLLAINTASQEQTKEHLILASQVGIKDVVLFVNKMDLLDGFTEEEIEFQKDIAVESVKQIADAHGMRLPVIRFGSVKYILEALPEEGSDKRQEAVERREREINNIIEMFDEIEEKIPLPPAKETKPFYMYIDEIYYIKGRGVVVSGKVTQGTLTVGDTIEIIGQGTKKQSVITSIEAFNKSQPSCMAGQNVGILARGLDLSDVQRGYIACKPGLANYYSTFHMKIDLLTTKEGGRANKISSGYQPSFFIGTGQYTGTIEFLEDRSDAFPGDTNIMAKITFFKPVPYCADDNPTIVIREEGTIGCAKIIKVVG